MEVALCLDAISGYDGIDDRSLGAPRHGSTTFAADLAAQDHKGANSLSGFRVGILKEAFEQAIVEPRMRTAVLDAARKFSALGATVEEVSIPDHLLGTAIWTVEQRVSGCLSMMGKAAGRRGLGLTKLEEARLPWTQEKFDKLFPTTKNIFLNGIYLMEKFPALYAKAQNLSRRLRDEYETALQKYDVLILPTTSFVAPAHGQLTTPIDTISPTIGLTSNTTMFDATGQPAMSIPIGWLPAKEDSNVKLPAAMQIVSGLWQDGKVLKAGHAWQEAYDWKKVNYEGVKA
ncbi:Amidase [Macrophomina phaseolina MS6]|uniref:Amidase n=2 Tax=Macrophomina phaseolina TaxID=35725 RepID=K2RFG0_MACPH|nr:Amidase [Macrophomina phaseolina MS6]